MFHNYSAANSAVRHWAKHFDKLHHRLSDQQNGLDVGHSKLGIVHNFRHLQIVWPMSGQFHHIGSNVGGTLSNCLEWMPNCFEDMPFFTHNVEVMLNDELKPNFAELLRTSANLSAPTAGWGAEFCSCVESVLAIGHLQLQKGVFV